MNYKSLRKNIGKPIRLFARHTNATLPLSDWFIRAVNRRRHIIEIENHATGYRLEIGPAEIYGFNEASCALDLRIGLKFACPNVRFVYPIESVVS